MFTIRFHGRGGQGMKTASHFLGNAFFLAGYEVQDAPRYGAERRGAPMTSYVRADKQPIYERGIIQSPSLVVVSDDSLIPIAAAGVMQGFGDDTVLLIISHESAETWQNRLNLPSPVKTFQVESSATPVISAACAGAAAALTSVVEKQHLLEAIKLELVDSDHELLSLNIHTAIETFESMQSDSGIVRPAKPTTMQHYQQPGWVDLVMEQADISAPVIHASRTSVKIKTGLWRTQRPVINYDHCKHCWWICSSSCPDSVIDIDEQKKPVVDYDHCKGCMICVAQCPSHAIEAIAEVDARQGEAQ